MDDAVERVSHADSGGEEELRKTATMSTQRNGLVKQQTSSPRNPSKKRPLGEDTSANVSSAKGKFHKTNIEDIIIVEICAGSARLTKTARSMGFKGVAVDHSSKRSCGVDICIFDLANPAELEALLEYIRKDADRIALIWIAPSCGTASRARERPIPGQDTCPQPLRSEMQPDALDKLSGMDKYKVEMANLLYDAVLQIVECAVPLDICVGVENPTNSHYWNTTPTKKFIEKFGDRRVTFHACAHGGARDKLTTIWQSKAYFDSLQLRCDKKHSHASWRPRMKDGRMQYPTAEEASYPYLLCERIVACVLTQVQSMGAIYVDNFQSQMEVQQSTQQRRIAMGALPRGSKIKPLVSEFQSYETLHCDPQQPQQLEKMLKKFPKGARVTHRRLVTGDVLRGSEKFQQLDGELRGILQECEAVEICTVGIPAEPLDFLDRAVRAGHPRGVEVHVDEMIHKLVMENFHELPYNLAKKRIEFFKKWQDRAKALDVEGDAFIRDAPEHARTILKGKRLQLWDEILKDLGYVDTHLIADIARGFDLTGWLRKSGVFATGVRRPGFSRDTLLKLAKGLNQATLKSMERRQDEVLEGGTWTETTVELEKGWIWDATGESMDGKVIAKRFGLQQGAKLRVIDDCSCGGLNHSVGLAEKFQLHTIDQLASMIAHSFSRAGANGHPRVVGRTYDLRAAYKQFPVSLADREILRIAVCKPGASEPSLFGVNALPFGAVGSVAGFLRISHALWFIGVAALGLCWTAFYDDFSVLTREELLHSTSLSCELLFRLLGVDFADSGKKAVPFSRDFKMLGLVVNTETSSKGSLTITHTVERRQELVDSMTEVLQAGVLSSKDAERLRGRMVFFEGYTFGRIANAAVKNLGRVCLGTNANNRLASDLQTVLKFLIRRVESAEPIRIERCFSTTWLVFTDGACEPEQRSGGIGGLLITPNGACASYFSSAVPKWLMDKLLNVSANPIHELELLPVYLAMCLWSSRFSYSQVVWYIDNESSRMAAIRGSGETVFASIFIDAFVKDESDWQIKSWFSRVPSHSNPADGVSRLLCDLPISLGAEQTTIGWERCRSLVDEVGIGAGGSEGRPKC